MTRYLILHAVQLIPMDLMSLQQVSYIIVNYGISRLLGTLIVREMRYKWQCCTLMSTDRYRVRYNPDHLNIR